MKSLRFTIAMIPEDGMPIDIDVPVSELAPDNVEPLPVRQVTVQGVLESMGEQFLFRGDLSGSFVHPCDRCLMNLEVPFEFEMTCLYEEGPAPGPLAWAQDGDEDDGEETEDALAASNVRTYQGHELDLGPAVWEELAFAVPMKFTCPHVAEGLCDQGRAHLEIGEDLFTGDEPAPGNNAFAGLADLFPDLVNEKKKKE